MVDTISSCIVSFLKVLQSSASLKILFHLYFLSEMLAIAVEHVTFDGWICLDFVLLLLFVFLNDDCVWFLWGSVDAECIDLMYRFESGNWS